MNDNLTGGARVANPLYRPLNIFVHRMANKLFPCGFDVTMDEDEAPDSLRRLTAHIGETNRMLVWGGDSEDTIFDCPETNWAFRAWHDWCHWKGQFPFTVEGERTAARMQMDHIINFVGDPVERGKLTWLVHFEVVGQAEHYENYGDFPENQREWTEKKLASVGVKL